MSLITVFCVFNDTSNKKFLVSYLPLNSETPGVNPESRRSFPKIRSVRAERWGLVSLVGRFCTVPIHFSFIIKIHTIFPVYLKKFGLFTILRYLNQCSFGLSIFDRLSKLWISDAVTCGLGGFIIFHAHILYGRLYCFHISDNVIFIVAVNAQGQNRRVRSSLKLLK